MANIINPNWKPHLDLVADDATWDALKLVVTNYLDANAGSAAIDIAEIRALDDQLADDRIWAQLSSDLGLFEIA